MRTTTARRRTATILVGVLVMTAAAVAPSEAQVPLGFQIGWSDFGSHHLVNPDGTDSVQQGPARGGDFDWTPDGLYLVYVDGGTTVLQNPDGATFPIDGVGGGPELSPDGSMIAHTAFDADTQEDVVHIIDTQGNLLARVEPAGRQPTWSPDGTQIAFASREEFTRGCPGDTRNPENRTTDDFNPHGLRVADVPSNLGAGSPATLGSSWLVQPSTSVGEEYAWYEGLSDPDWGPGGEIVFFGSFETREFDPNDGSNFGSCVSGNDPEEDDTDVLVVSEGGGAITNLTEGAEWIGGEFPTAPADLNPSFSPDGEWIAFASDRNTPRDGGVHSLWRMRADGSSPELVLATERVDETDWRSVIPGAESVRIEALDPDAGEVGTSGTNGGNFTIERTGVTDGDLEVSIRVSPESTAVAGEDYVALPTSVTIPDGTNLVNLIVAPIPDDVDEPAETVVVEITDGDGYIIGDPRQATVTIADARTSREEAIEYAAQLALARFEDADGTFAGAGRQRAAGAVLARVDVFADALTGSVLTGDAPMLFTAQDALAPAAAAQLQRTLTPGATVYLLGGEAALSGAVEQAVADLGLSPRRLSGPTRIETAVAIADEAVARGGGTTVGVARAFGPEGNPTAAWVDSVAAGGWAADTQNPILLVPGDADALPEPVQAFLDRSDHDAAVVLGGDAAVSPAIADSIEATRVGGQTRFDTAAQIAAQLWQAPGPERLVANGTEGDAWNYALAAAGRSADADAPLLLTTVTSLPPETDAALCATGTRQRHEVIGPLRLVTQPVRDALASPC